MTINELYNPIREAVDNGCGNLEVYAQEFGKHHKLLPIDFVNIVSEWSSGSKKKEYAEIVYESDYSEEDIKKFNDIQVQSYRNERQLIFDAWKKSDKESAHIIKDLLDCMQHRMGEFQTQVDRDMVCKAMNNAENYVDRLETGCNYEMIVPVVKEK